MTWIFALLFSSNYGWTAGCGPAGSTLTARPGVELSRSNVLGRADVCNVRVRGPGGRYFKFNSRGDLTVSLGEDSGPPVTVCQFRILPTGSVDTGVLNDGTVKSSGVEWRFDSSGNLVGSDGCSYELSSPGTEANNCGFKIKSCRGRVVLAWPAKTINSAREKTPEGTPAGKATVITPAGARSCQVGNSSVLSYQRVSPTASHPLCGKNGAPPQDKCTERESNSSDQAGFDELPMNKSGSHLSSVLSEACGGDFNFLIGGAMNGVGGGGVDAAR